MTEEQIQREIAKHRTEQTGINQIIKPATENTVSDRSHPTQQALLPLTEQRDEHKPKQPVQTTLTSLSRPFFLISSSSLRIIS